MQWTPFGRVDPSLDSIPRAKMTPRPSREGRSFEEWTTAMQQEQYGQATARGDQDEAGLSVQAEPQTAAAPVRARDEQRAATSDESRDGDNVAGAASTTGAMHEERSPAGDASALPRTATTSPGNAAPNIETAKSTSTDASSTARLSALPLAGEQQTREPLALGIMTALETTSARTNPSALSPTWSPRPGEDMTSKSVTAASSVRNTMPALLTEEQHVSLLRRIAMAATERGGELRLLLEPAQLGSLGVRLRIDGNAVRLELRADSAEVAALLERDASALEAELAAQGLSIDGFDIGSSSREEQHEAQRRFEDEVAKRDLDEIHSGLMALRQRVGTRAATVIRVAAPPTSIDTPTVANLDTVA